MKLQIKRVYEAPAGDDGKRILVDRLWPRGLSRDKAAIDTWIKEVAPSNELRRWYNHEPAKWEEFRKRYLHELEGKTELVTELRKEIGKGPATLLCAAKDAAHSNARVLADAIQSRH